tara:strand:+ start:30000 stop:30149 length:150 start_codon:yes stop_codon:yes gene_type:complete
MRKKSANRKTRPDRTLGVLEALEARARATGRGEREATGTVQRDVDPKRT